MYVYYIAMDCMWNLYILCMQNPYHLLTFVDKTGINYKQFLCHPHLLFLFSLTDQDLHKTEIYCGLGGHGMIQIFSLVI